MINKWTKRTLLGVLLLFLFVLGACSQDNEAASGGDSDEGSAEGEEASDESKTGGTFTIAMPADPDTLDPHRTTAGYTHYFAGLVYNKLISYETGPEIGFTDFILTPDLAEEWEVSDDGLVYTFHLREAFWQDIEPVNGRELDAEDVVATMERIQTLPGIQKNLLGPLETVEASDDRTVVFTLEKPFAPFLNNIANHYMWILPKEAVDGEIDLDTTAIGTGPFILDEWQTNVQASFKRNPNFYDEGKPYLDEVIVMAMSDTSAALSALRTGQVEQVLSVLSPEDLENISKSNPETQFMESMSSSPVQLFLNLDREPLDDILVRKAISMAIDKQNAVEQIFGSGEISGLINPSLGDWALPIEEREELQPYDAEEAKELLVEAGYPDGFDLKLLTTNMYGEQITRSAEWVVEDLKAIDINVEIDMQESATFLDMMNNQEYDIGITYPHVTLEPDQALTSLFHSEGSRNMFGTNDPELDEMIVEQRSLLEEDERKEYVHDIQRYILEDVVNPINLNVNYNENPIPGYVQNWNPHITFGWTHMKDVWIDENLR